MIQLPHFEPKTKSGKKLQNIEFFAGLEVFGFASSGAIIITSLGGRHDEPSGLTRRFSGEFWVKEWWDDVTAELRSFGEKKKLLGWVVRVGGCWWIYGIFGILCDDDGFSMNLTHLFLDVKV